MNKEVEELLKKIEEKEKIIRKYELLLDRFKISDEQENANPNEEFESLKKLGEYELKQGCLVEDLTVYDIVKQDFIKSQEQKNVLEIIKELISKNCKIELIDGGTYYQIRIKVMGSGYTFGMSITKQEFDLLKKWMGKDKSE